MLLTLLCDKKNRIIRLINLTMNVAIQSKHGESSIIIFSGEMINSMILLVKFSYKTT